MPIKCHLSRMLGEKKMNMSDLSKSAGIARNTVSALFYENGKGVTWAVLDKLCTALNCQPGDLLEYFPVDRRNPNDNT